MPVPQPIVVFDLDGTLIDTAPDLLDSLNHVLVQHGLSAVDHDAFVSHVGMGGRVMLQRAFDAAGRTLTTDQADIMVNQFVDHYSAGMPGRSRPYDMVMERVAMLREAGYRTAVCTNKMSLLANRLVEALGIRASFDAVCGADTFPVRKPDPAHLTGTIKMAGGDASRAVMVGDSRTDIDTAKAAGIPVIAVDFGYTPQPVATFAPDIIISHYREFTLDMIEGLMATKSG